MRSIIFSNHLARDVRRLGATIDVEHSNIRFLNNLTLNLWDCGGQDRLMDTFLETQREEVFSNVAVCVYVFDVESGGFLGDLSAFERVCAALGELNRVAGRNDGGGGSEKGKDGKEGTGCRVWVCVHKMDLVKNLGVIPGAEGEPTANGHRKTVGVKRFEEKCAEISKRAGAFGESIEFFGTSIWDQSLYRAWTRIIYHLIPNAVAIENMLGKLTKVIGARECTLFERTTCLTIASAIGKGFGDAEGEGEDGNPVEGRGEMMSGILKSWKQSLSCVASATLTKMDSC